MLTLCLRRHPMLPLPLVLCAALFGCNGATAAAELSHSDALAAVRAQLAEDAPKEAHAGPDVTPFAADDDREAAQQAAADWEVDEQGLDDEDTDTDTDEDEDEASCTELRQKLAEDIAALEETDAYQAMTDTKEYKRLHRILTRMERKHCDMSNRMGTSAPCRKLMVQLKRSQMALVRTPEFRALARTSEFRAVVSGYRQAVMEGCLDEAAASMLKGIFTPTGEPLTAATHG